MSPARLDHADAWVGEGRDGLPEKAARRNEVRVEDGDQLAARAGDALAESTCLVTAALAAMEVVDGETGRTQTRDELRDDRRRAVGRVVEHLDLEPLARIVEPRDRLDQTGRHGHLVVEGELNGHDRPRLGTHDGRRRIVSRAGPRAQRAVPVTAGVATPMEQPEEPEP